MNSDDELHDEVGINRRHEIVSDNAPPTGKPSFDPSTRKWLPDIQEAEEGKGEENRLGMKGDKEQCDNHPDHLVNNHSPRIPFREDVCRLRGEPCGNENGDKDRDDINLDGKIGEDSIEAKPQEASVSPGGAGEIA